MGFDVGSLFAGGIEGVLKGAKDVIGAFKADPTIVAQNAAKLAELEVAIKQAELDYELKLSLAQVEIDKIEAASSDKFTSRWRPAVGWVCCLGLLYATLLAPLLGWLALNVAGWKQPPTLNTDVLTTTLFAMLGIAGMRSFDKLKGTARK
jgi:hypothetical protein